MKATDPSQRRADRFAFFPRIAPLRVALCALLLAGCTTGGPQGNGDIAGRQDPATVSAVSVATVISIAERMRATGNLPAAIAFYRRAIVLDPNQVKPYIGLGDTLVADGEPNAAADSFRSALNMAPNDPEALRGLGQTLVALNKPVEAVEMLNRSIRFQPSARAYGALGVAYDLMGKPAEATEAFKHGLTLAPDDLDILNNYGLSQAIGGDFDGAVATLRRAAMDPRASSRNRLNLAMALGLAGRDHDAAQVARIDLDERAVQNNLAYYAELRGLPPTARAEAILRPSSPLLAQLAAPVCEGKPCPPALLPGDKMGAAPTTPVTTKPLAAASGNASKSAASEKKAAATSLEPAAKAAQDEHRAKAAAAKEAADHHKSAKPAHDMTAKAASSARAAEAMAAETPAPEAKPAAKADGAKTEAAASGPAAMPAAKAKSTAELNKDQSQRLAAAEPVYPAEPAPSASADAATPGTTAPMTTADAAPALSGAPLPITAGADKAPAAKPEPAMSAMDKAEPMPADAAAMTKAAAPAADNTPSPSQLAAAMPNPVYSTYPPAAMSESDKPAAKPILDPARTAAAHAAPQASPDAMSAATPQQLAAMPDMATTAPSPAAEPEKAKASPAATPGDSFVAATGEPAPAASDALPAAEPAATPGLVVKADAVVGEASAGKPQPWVQLGTFRSEDNAKAQLKQTATAHEDLLDGLPLSIHRIDLGAVRGVYYLLRVGPTGNLEQARDLCTALKSHKLDCLVVK